MTAWQSIFLYIDMYVYVHVIVISYFHYMAVYHIMVYKLSVVIHVDFMLQSDKAKYMLTASFQDLNEREIITTRSLDVNTKYITIRACFYFG